MKRIIPIKRTDPRLPALPPLPECAIGFHHIRPFWATDEDNPKDFETQNHPDNLVPYSSLREHWELTRDQYQETGDVRYGRDAFLIKLKMREEPEEWERRCHSQAMSELHKGNQNHLGHKHTEATKARMSAAHKGNTHSLEARAKMSAAKTGDKNHRFGKTHSAESRERISASMKKYYAAKKAAA